MTAPAAGRDLLRRMPGAEGIWALIGADAVVFAILFATFMQERRSNLAVFEAGRQTLNLNLGGIDTLILLTSSWCVAMAIQALRGDRREEVSRYLLAGALTGALFAVSKTVEYLQKISHGITPATDSFYMWYFVLTGIHLLHVLIGTGLLTFVWSGSRRGAYGSANPVVPESVASFWHLVDLLWIMLFPLLYLMKAQ
ncbi:MAG: cytochrome c oxidase subunit 3 family protein [Candidatus Nanopelagicales bacterium]